VTRIDLGHGVRPGDIWDASFQLQCAWPHLPTDCVVMAVVDPGVGTERRAVVVTAGTRSLLAPGWSSTGAVWASRNHRRPFMPEISSLP
jgi:S-adenosylmethionine hydrolase